MRAIVLYINNASHIIKLMKYWTIDRVPTQWEHFHTLSIDCMELSSEFSNIGTPHIHIPERIFNKLTFAISLVPFGYSSYASILTWFQREYIIIPANTQITYRNLPECVCVTTKVPDKKKSNQTLLVMKAKWKIIAPAILFAIIKFLQVR